MQGSIYKSKCTLFLFLLFRIKHKYMSVNICVQDTNQTPIKLKGLAYLDMMNV